MISTSGNKGRSLRLAMVADSLGKGGAERQFALLAKGLREEGYLVEAAVLYDNGYWGNHLSEKSIRVANMGFRAPPNINYKIGGPLLRFYKWLRNNKPDIVVSFLYRPSIWTSLVARLAGVRVIVNRRADCGFVRKKAPFPSWLEQRAIRWTDWYVANSNAVGRSLSSERIPEKKVRVIHNGTILPGLASNGTKRLPSKIIGVLGNLSEIKDHLTLIRALPAVLKRFPDATCELAGGDAGLESKIRREVGRLGLDDNVRFLGSIQDVGQFLGRIGIGVLCSRSEGFSNAILEYMASAKPVVATRCDGNCEIIVHEKTGFLFSPGDEAQCAEYLVRLLEKPTDAISMGLAGRRRVEKEFSDRSALIEWDKFLRSVLPACTKEEER